MRETDRPTLLIVDDEPNSLDALQQALKSRFDVLPAHSGQEALELLRSRAVQVLVTDQRMPGMSGVEVLAAARAERPEVARVMLTGCTDPQDFADAVNLGGVEYIVTDPWDADELVGVLERAVAVARRAEKEIAERRQAEAAARRAEADLSALIENSDTSLWSLDKDYRLLAFNTRFREAARQGLGREISIGENILPEVPEAIREEWTSHYDRCLRGESFRIVTPTVPPLPLRINEYRFNPIRLADGQVAGLTIFANDVTDRWQAEANLVASEKRYRELYQSLMDAYALVDMTGGFRQYNETFRAMLGYSDDELRRMTYVDLTPEKWHAYEQKILAEQLLSLGYSQVYEKEYRRRDGTVFPVELRTFLIRDEAGQPDGMWALIRDITERKQAEEALAESQTLLNSIVNSTTDLIWSVEAPSFGLLTFNQAFFDYFLGVLGVHARKGMRPADLLPTAELAQTWLAFYQRALKEGSYTSDYEMQTSRRTLLLSINVLERERAVWGISVFAHDITERKHAEEEVHRQAARAEALVQTAARLSGQLDLNKTLQAVCEETTRALNVPVAVVDLYDQRRRALCYAADVGLPAELRGYALPVRPEALASPLAAAPASDGLLAALNSPATATMAFRRDDELMGAVRVFAADGARQFTVDELALLRGLADHASQAITNARLYEQVRAGREQLQMLSRQLVQAQETERQALAHELHDQIGQNLTGLSSTSTSCAASSRPKRPLRCAGGWTTRSRWSAKPCSASAT